MKKHLKLDKEKDTHFQEVIFRFLLLQKEPWVLN